MSVTLQQVRDEALRHDILWFLLEERPPHVNISHKKMPTWEEHVAFVDSDPYAEWWFITDGDALQGETYFGACYVTRQNEIGIQIFKRFLRKGYASAALKVILERYKGRRLLANIAPTNDASIELFYKHGFGLIQYTYELNA